jgi:hypothetical protein
VTFASRLGEQAGLFFQFLAHPWLDRAIHSRTIAARELRKLRGVIHT